jgi:hypothetical protein
MPILILIYCERKTNILTFFSKESSMRNTLSELIKGIDSWSLNPFLFARNLGPLAGRSQPSKVKAVFSSVNFFSSGTVAFSFLFENIV